MTAALRKLAKIIAAGLGLAARTAATHEAMPWGDGPRPLWRKTGGRS